MIIFPLIFVASFIWSLREIYNGKSDGIFTFLIFGLSMYTTAMSVTFSLGLSFIIPVFQFFKEVLVLGVLTINVLNLRQRPKFHLLDYLIFAFLVYTAIYVVLPIGGLSFVERLLAFKSTSFYIVVYFTGRFFNLRSLYVNKYLSYIAILTIAAGIILTCEVLLQQQLQLYTGFAEYCYYYFNMDFGGTFGIGTTFESEGGYRRFASFFNNPLEHAAATLLALAAILALLTDDNNRFKAKPTDWMALAATFLSIIFAFSRAPLASYFFIIYVYSLLTHRKTITWAVHIGVAVATVYVIYLFTQFEQNHTGIVEVLVNTIDFSNPSSVGHLVEWVEGIMAMIQNPFGLGLGTSGRVAGSLGDNVGGENQFIIIGVQAGVIALFIYLAIYILFIKMGIKWLNKLKGKERKICMAVLLMKIGFFIPMLTSEVESSSYLSYINWLLSGIFVSIIMQQQSTANQTVTAKT